MNTVRIGRCSLCGGDVMAHHGAWWGIDPPPPPTCATCGAVEKGRDKVIEMERPTVGPVRKFINSLFVVSEDDGA